LTVSAPPVAARRSGLVPPLLRENQAFRRFFAGQAVSLVGDQITLIALPLVGVLVLHAGAAQMGYLTTAALLPNLLFSLHAGAWVDRRGRRCRSCSRPTSAGPRCSRRSPSSTPSAR
jgi:MFS family permease